eukprot:1159453-Pelagomonas_calceolata.AAC.8
MGCEQVSYQNVRPVYFSNQCVFLIPLHTGCDYHRPIHHPRAAQARTQVSPEGPSHKEPAAEGGASFSVFPKLVPQDLLRGWVLSYQTDSGVWGNGL